MKIQHGTKKYTTTFHPRFSDFDLQGILNSRQYIDLLTEARFDQMRRCYHYPIENYIKKNQHWVVAKIELNFESPIFPGKPVSVSTSVTKIEGPKAFVCFTFTTEGSLGDKLHSFGTVEYVLIDLSTKAPIAISDTEKEIFL